jgi:hypothetical protein
MTKNYPLSMLLLLGACSVGGKAQHFPVTVQPPPVAAVELEISPDKLVSRTLGPETTIETPIGLLPKD